MDPLSMMFMAAKMGAGAESGASESMLQPSGMLPQPAAMPAQSPMTAATANPGGGGNPLQGLGEQMSGLQAPKAPDPKFSGGVSGSGLPYVSRIEDMINPFMQASGAGKPGMMPTLGQLFAQAPGGGR